MDGMVTCKINNHCIQALQLAAVTEMPTTLKASPAIQRMFTTGFICKRLISNGCRVSSQRPSSRECQSKINCENIHARLQQSYKLSDNVLYHCERQAWHTWIYSCREINTSGPDCIAVIKVSLWHRLFQSFDNAL